MRNLLPVCYPAENEEDGKVNAQRMRGCVGVLDRQTKLAVQIRAVVAEHAHHYCLSMPRILFG